MKRCDVVSQGDHWKSRQPHTNEAAVTETTNKTLQFVSARRLLLFFFVSNMNMTHKHSSFPGAFENLKCEDIKGADTFLIYPGRSPHKSGNKAGFLP